jgi:hypothetical protein
MEAKDRVAYTPPLAGIGNGSIYFDLDQYRFSKKRPTCKASYKRKAIYTTPPLKRGMQGGFEVHRD